MIIEKKRKKRTLWKIAFNEQNIFGQVDKFTTWLDCDRRFKIKNATKWWKWRLTIKKISIFYGIFNFKKFRYINNFVLKKTAIRTFFVIKLETMVNVILFRMNLFSNTYFSNNFIRYGGLYVNNKKIIYPYRFMRKLDVLLINKYCFKKIFNIFFKKLFFSRKLLKKNNRFNKYNRINTPKILLNCPRYLETNYKVLHSILWRPPYRKEILGTYGYLVSSIHDWNDSTRVGYM